ncbi:MAG: helix-turn-helix domain-containing protein [Pseudomonadota bacterium]
MITKHPQHQTGRPESLDRYALTYREAADLVGVSERTLFEWASQGRLRVMRVGRTVRVSVWALREFVEAHESPAENSEVTDAS